MLMQSLLACVFHVQRCPCSGVGLPVKCARDKLGRSLICACCCDQVRLQRPTVSAEMSFLLEVVTFFVPNLALDGAKTAPFRTHDLLLTGALVWKPGR